MVYYRVHNRLPLVCTHPAADPLTSKFLSLGYIVILLPHIRISLTGDLIPLCFPTKPLC
jgi:hypothetical protein